MAIKIDMDDGWYPRASTLDMWLARTVLNGTHLAVVNCIIRYTYGWEDKHNGCHDEKIKKRRTRAQIPGKVFQDYGWLSKSVVSRAISDLVGWNIIGRDNAKNPAEYWFNPSVAGWSKLVFRNTEKKQEFKRQLLAIQSTQPKDGDVKNTEAVEIFKDNCIVLADQSTPEDRRDDNIIVEQGVESGELTTLPTLTDQSTVDYPVNTELTILSTPTPTKPAPGVDPGVPKESTKETKNKKHGDSTGGESRPSPAVLETCKHLTAFWNQLSGQNLKDSHRAKKRRAHIKARLQDGYTLDDLKLAIAGVCSSVWHQNNGQVKMELAIRSFEKTEEWLHRAGEYNLWCMMCGGKKRVKTRLLANGDAQEYMVCPNKCEEKP